MIVISTDKIAKAPQNLFTLADNLLNISTQIQTVCKTFRIVGSRLSGVGSLKLRTRVLQRLKYLDLLHMYYFKKLQNTTYPIGLMPAPRWRGLLTIDPLQVSMQYNSVFARVV